jgi:uncharacterized protein YcfJ
MATVVGIVLFVAFLWWANSSSIGGRARQAQRDGNIERAKSESNNLARIRAGLIGVVIGAVVGSFFGIAGFGSAIAGTIPGALMLGYWFYAAKK